MMAENTGTPDDVDRIRILVVDDHAIVREGQTRLD